jgi:ribonuclease E
VAEAEPVEDVPVAEIEDAPVVEDAPVIEIAEPVAEDAPVIEIAAAPDQDAPVAGLSVVPPEAQVYELSPPVVEEEPVEEAQVLEFAPIGEPQADDDELADLTSPSLEALARDVAAAHAEAEDDGSGDDAEPITLRSVETVSAMDLIMGAADEDNPSDDAPASA